MDDLRCDLIVFTGGKTVRRILHIPGDTKSSEDLLAIVQKSLGKKFDARALASDPWKMSGNVKMPPLAFSILSARDVAWVLRSINEGTCELVTIGKTHLDVAAWPRESR